jgi:hypothetical protein
VRSLVPGHIVFGMFFLLAPVANPWYLLWMLPFLTLQPTVWGLSALAVVSLSYVHGLYLPDSGLPPYHHPEWVRPVEIATLAVALGVDLFLNRRTRVARQQLAAPGDEASPHPAFAAHS